jgi:hypothetical protein
MLSILSSFKLQMNAAATIGNCCSNFHQIIFHLLKGGCGLHIDNTGQCLQYRKESIYQLCCDVRSRRSCVKRRLARLRNEYNDGNITVSGVEAKLWEEWKRKGVMAEWLDKYEKKEGGRGRNSLISYKRSIAVHWMLLTKLTFTVK